MSNSTELPDLLPCPFCGSTNLSIETNSVQPDDFHDAWVNCGECNADGRHAMTLEGWLPTKAEAKEEAVVAWNRRAQPKGEAPQADDVVKVVAVLLRYGQALIEFTGNPPIVGDKFHRAIGTPEALKRGVA